MTTRERARARLVELVVAVVAAGGAAAGCTFDPDHLPVMTFDIPADKVWPTAPLMPSPGPGEGRIYVTDNLEDTISVIDLDSADAGAPVLLGKVPAGFVPVEREGPHHCVAGADGQFYYYGVSNFVPGSGSGPHGVHGAGTIPGHMVKMRVSDNSFVAASRVDPNPGDIRLTPDGKTLVASHFDLAKVTTAIGNGITEGPDVDSRLAIIDPETMDKPTFVETCPAAHGIGFTPDSSTAVTSCYNDHVAIIDLVGDDHHVDVLQVIDNPGTLDNPICQPYGITVDGETAWVSCFSSGEVIGVDIPSRSLNGQKFQLPGVASFGDVRGDTMLIAHQNTDGVTLFDVSGGTLTFESTIFVSPSDCVLPHVARFNEDGTKIFTVCEGDHTNPGSFLVFDAAPPHALLGKVTLGIFPDDIAAMRVPQ